MSYLNRHTNLKQIPNPCINLHKLSIMLRKDIEFILLLSIVPNIRCLHVSLGYSGLFYSLVVPSDIVMSYLIEFSLHGDSGACCTMEELMSLLHIMPNVQRLLLSIMTYDQRLLDGEQIRSMFFALNMSSLNKFSYAVEYKGELLDRKIIYNLEKKWFPQQIAYIFDKKYSDSVLYTIPFKFQRFWSRSLPTDAENSIAKGGFALRYGEGAYITHCITSHLQELSHLCTVLQKSSYMKNHTICALEIDEKDAFSKYENNI